VTFAELQQLARRAAELLVDEGAGAGSRVVLYLENSAVLRVLEHAVLGFGMVRVALSPRLHPNEVAAELTARVRTADGWFATGDLARIDENGYVHLVDRKNDVIISGGFNIFPGEVERVIVTVDGVAEAVVLGLPDERWGEGVHAAVVLTPSAAREYAGAAGWRRSCTRSRRRAAAGSPATRSRSRCIRSARSRATRSARWTARRCACSCLPPGAQIEPWRLRFHCEDLTAENA
jgi:acyl-CoA synthetase (AMP-forming)/AMP-acid ligase II